MLCIAVMMRAQTFRGEAQSRSRPIIIGHRGASGYVPEHTIASYAIAIEQGADFIEPDLVMSRDGVLVARHENEIGGTTDVAAHPEFAVRRRAKTIDGHTLTGWFTEDFTVAELKTLRARERLPRVRPANTRFDGSFAIPTFDEILSFVRATNWRLADDAERAGLGPPRRIGVYPETKHPTYHQGIGLPLEMALIEALRRHGMEEPELAYIQSFEVGNLRQLARLTRLPLVQLIDCGGGPCDFAVSGDPRTYADLTTPSGLAGIAGYAAVIGANKDLILPREADGAIGRPSTLIADAHGAGLAVHGWTFRAENRFLPANLRAGADPNAYGDLAGEIEAFLAAGIDGFFTDNPDIGLAARDGFAARR